MKSSASPHKISNMRNFLLRILFAALLAALMMRAISQYRQLSRVADIKNMPAQVFLDQFSASNFADLPPATPQAVYLAISARALALSPPDIDIARKAVESANAINIPCLDCQIKLVYLDIATTGDFTSEGLTALQRSYAMSPYGKSEIMFWRLTVSSIYWHQLTDELRAQALTQITALAEDHKGRQRLRKFETPIAEIEERRKRAIS